MAWAYFLFWRQSLPLCSSSKTRPGFMQTNWSAPSQCSQVLGTFGFRCSFKFIGKMDGFPSSALKLLLPAYNPISLSTSMAFLQSSWPFIVVDLFKDKWWLSDRIHWWSPNLWLHHTCFKAVSSLLLCHLFFFTVFPFCSLEDFLSLVPTWTTFWEEEGGVSVAASSSSFTLPNLF